MCRPKADEDVTRRLPREHRGRSGRHDRRRRGRRAFLASDHAPWISGDTLFVDGASLTRRYPMMLDIVHGLGG
jgi:hypothetical protein